MSSQPKFDPELNLFYTEKNELMYVEPEFPIKGKRGDFYPIGISYAISCIMKYYHISYDSKVSNRKNNIFHARLKFDHIPNLYRTWVVLKDVEWETKYPVKFSVFQDILKTENSNIIKYSDYSWECDWFVFKDSSAKNRSFSLYPVLEPIVEKTSPKKRKNDNKSQI